MSRKPNGKTLTVGSSTFDPAHFLNEWQPSRTPSNDGLADSIINAFGLKQSDDYVYHATASVTLAQVQAAINYGAANGMHAWYRDEAGNQIDPPSQADVEAYTRVFVSTTVTTKALAALAANAKKGSLRASVAKHLQEKLLLPTQASGLVLPGKQKANTATNPALDFWIWSCRCLEWAGPDTGTVNIKQSHHILPIFYHHFGCVCPTYDAISLILQLSKSTDRSKGQQVADRPILDVGSGNGYWTLLLRRAGLTVYPIDNALSAWRTTWVPDTITVDAVTFLTSKTLPPAIKTGSPQVGKGGAGAILLLVYPQVSNNFTANVINAYRGDVIVVAGTQNHNGFTAFASETVAEWMKRERQEFDLAAQIPLPSFAGKDEALFIFIRRSSIVSI